MALVDRGDLSVVDLPAVLEDFATEVEWSVVKTDPDAWPYKDQNRSRGRPRPTTRA